MLKNKSSYCTCRLCISLNAYHTEFTKTVNRLSCILSIFAIRNYPIAIKCSTGPVVNEKTLVFFATIWISWPRVRFLFYITVTIIYITIIFVPVQIVKIQIASCSNVDKKIVANKFSKFYWIFLLQPDPELWCSILCIIFECCINITLQVYKSAIWWAAKHLPTWFKACIHS